MLVELDIEDLALIERASLPFEAGLNVVTGETGAGKSLLIDALEILLGQRARSGLVRAGAPKARVEGRFHVASGEYGRRVGRWLGEHLPQVLEEDATGDGDLEIILTRTLGADGRSRAHVNHRPVTRRVLRELATQLVEIHGQNDHQKLFDPAEQTELLDAFGRLESWADAYRAARASWLEARRRLQRAGDAGAQERLELLRFQVQELADASPSVHEREALVDERERLRHADRLREDVSRALDDLCESDRAALDVLRRWDDGLSPWEERIPPLGTAVGHLRDAVAHTEEASAGLRSVLDTLESDPARLDEVEERLHLYSTLERKYRVDVAGLVELHDELMTEIGRIEGAQVSSDELEAAVAECASAVRSAGELLEAKRRKLAPRLQKAVGKALAELGLEKAQVTVAFQPAPDDVADWGPHGPASAEFQLAANPGETAAPLRKVASGGEMARIMLALRGALAVQQSTPTLIFDEVDTGVGGRLGPKVGAHLRKLASHHQILGVTHLPALAAEAHHHLRVSKQVQGGRTRTAVELLHGDERVEEIADMIAGGAEQATAKAEARRLLDKAAARAAGA